MKNLFPFPGQILLALAVAFVALLALSTHQLIRAGTAAAFAGLVVACTGMLAVLIVAALGQVVDVLKPLLLARAGGSIAGTTMNLSPPLTHRQQLELAAVTVMAGHAVGCSSGERSGKQVRAALDALTGSGTSARDSRDVASDPAGVLIVKAGEPLRAATSQTATRVTPADIEATIAAEYSFTLDKALAGCPLVDGLERVTLAIVVLRNGTKLVGVNYGAIDPSRHDAEQGRVEARAAAVEQVWPLLGYELRTKLAA